MLSLKKVQKKDRDLLCPYSNIEQDPDYTMAEFTIFPSFRRRHLAVDAAKMILARHPGKWEIKYNEKNIGAKKLWNTVTEPYTPEVYHLNEEETILSFETEGTIIAAFHYRNFREKHPGEAC